MIHLPIKIGNNRRMHVLQLTPTESCESEHITYLVNKGSIVPLLFSIDNVAKLFSATVNLTNVVLNTMSLSVVQEQNNNQDQTVFNVWLCNHPTRAKHNLVLLPTKADKQNSLQGDKRTLRFNTNNNHNKHIKIVFHIELGELIYTDTLSFYIYDQTKHEYCSAAVDFGSDSSQVRTSDLGCEGASATKEDNSNISLVDAFEGIAGQYKTENKNTYVQGKNGEQLYKSVFYIRKSNSAPVKFGGKPMGYNKEQFVQMLLPKNCSYWDELLLLPNLKLVEIHADSLLQEVVGRATKISFADNPNSEDTLRDGNISQPSFRNNVLRVILGYFLHAILHSINGAKCLNLVMLVPNVYSQDRVQRLINNLYKDFALYKATEEGQKMSCEAIEVQAISESDASFFGKAKDRADMSSMRAGETVLVIDAGKGTTDFSILKKNNGADFTSVYRDGIPASGNVITYAFYEAFRDFVYSANGGKVNLDNILFDARSEYALRVKALDYFEECKKRFRSNLQSVKMVNEYVTMSGNSNQRTQLSSIFDALVEDDNKKEWKGCYDIPGAEKRVEEKLNALSVMLFNSIDTYMSGVTTTAFTRVLLMGRAFKFAPFRKMVIDQLLDRGWVLNNDKQSISFDDNGDASKIDCIKGALRIGSSDSSDSINNNSGIIGAPIFYERVGGIVEKMPKVFTNIVEKVKHGKVVSRDNMNFYKKVVALNDDFYYKGFDYKPEEFFVVGDFKYSFNIGNAKSAKVYFNGKNFVCPQSTAPYGSVARMPSSITEEQVGKGNTPFDLLKQSLFPLNVVQGATTTIIEQTDTTVMEQKSDPYKNKTDNNSSNNADGDNNVLDN